MSRLYRRHKISNALTGKKHTHERRAIQKAYGIEATSFSGKRNTVFVKIVPNPTSQKVLTKLEKALTGALVENVLLEKHHESQEAGRDLNQAARGGGKRTRCPNGHLFD